MPSIREMYPRRWMDAVEFDKGQVYAGTIERVEFAGAFVDAETGVKKPVWELHFNEFQKPMKLNQTKTNVLASILGSERTEDWRGRRINFFRGIESYGGKAHDVFMIDQRLPDPVNPMLARDAASMYFKPEWGKSVVPKEHRDRFLELIQKHGKAWNDFLLWLKVKDDRAAFAAFGVALDAIPGSVIPAMKAYLDELAGVDIKTGEVATAPARLAPPPPPGPRFDPPPMGAVQPAAPAAHKPTGYEHPAMHEIEPDEIPF